MFMLKRVQPVVPIDPMKENQPTAEETAEAEEAQREWEAADNATEKVQYVGKRAWKESQKAVEKTKQWVLKSIAALLKFGCVLSTAVHRRAHSHHARRGDHCSSSLGQLAQSVSPTALFL